MRDGNEVTFSIFASYIHRVADKIHFFIQTARVGPGTFVGEMSLLSHEPAISDVVRV
jgi:CRP-like cAMP-binding protein